MIMLASSCIPALLWLLPPILQVNYLCNLCKQCNWSSEKKKSVNRPVSSSGCSAEVTVYCSHLSNAATFFGPEGGCIR